MINFLSKVFLFFLVSALLFQSPSSVSAHSTLLHTVPAPDSRLDTAPFEAVLEFSERLETKLFTIGVYNSKGLPVTNHKADMDKNRKVIRLQLPKLMDGGYTLTYQIISADGHPVKASYVFTVGALTDAKIGYSSATQLHEDHDISNNVGYWLVRIFYYLTLLMVAGWTGLRIYAPGFILLDGKGYRFITRILLVLYLAALFIIAWNDLSKLGQGFKNVNITIILFGTGIGLSYLISFLVAAVGFIVLRRWIWLDVLWLILLLGAKCLNGHAMGFRIPAITFVLDVLHLAAASVWSGVLLAFAVGWRMRRSEELAPLVPILSRAALWAVILLVLSGFFSALLYSNGFGHLLQTSWGRLLLAKSGAVVLVIGTGFMLRRIMKMRSLSRLKGWLSVDFVLYLAIISITGIFTYLNPLAATGPLFWHDSVKGMHITAIITPNEPGAANQFSVSIGTKSSGKILKKVTLHLQYLDNPDIAPIEVPLHQVNTNGSPLSLYNYNFSTEGSYLQFAGKWNLEVSVLDDHDDEYVTTKNFYNERK